MKPAFFAAPGRLAGKPAHGAPCNRCGLCCEGTLCPLGQHVFRRQLGPCPALEQDGDAAGCGLIDHPGRYVPILTLVNGAEAMGKAAFLLNGAGQGCDARFNGAPADQAFYARLRRWDRENRAAIKAARRLWRI